VKDMFSPSVRKLRWYGISRQIKLIEKWIWLLNAGKIDREVRSQLVVS